MRLALLVHAAASGSRFDAKIHQASLSLPDMGFTVIDMPARDELAFGLPRALEGTKSKASVLVYLSGQIERTASGATELVTELRSARIEEFRDAIAAAGLGDALLVIDASFTPPEDDPFAGTEVAASILQSMTPTLSGISTLVAVRRPLGGDDEAAQEEQATPLLTLLLDGARSAGQFAVDGVTAMMGRVYGQLREDDRLHVIASAHAYAQGATDFVLTRPKPQPFTNLPGVDEHFAEAESLLAAGKLDEALDACKRVLLLAGEDKTRRAEVFVRIAAIKQRQGKGRDALLNLEKALSINPAHRTALEGLIMVAASEARWGDVHTLGERLIETISSPEERAQALFDIGRVLHDNARDLERARSAFERAHALRPRDEELHRRLIEIYDHARHFAELTTLLESYAALTDHSFEKATRLAAAGKVAWKALGDRQRAIKLYDAALQHRRDDAELFGEFAEVLEQSEVFGHALRARQRSAALSPRKASSYSAIIRLAQREGRDDLAFNAAMVLAYLGEADMDEELLADQHRPDGPLRPTQQLAPQMWESLIAPSGSRHEMAVLEAIGELAIELKIDELREGGKLARLDPATKHEPRTSTVSAVRAFGYAAAFLGVAAPDLHILPDVAAGVAAVPTERATTAIGKQVLSGRSLPELSFLMARHLAYHRPGARVVLYYPNVNDLAALFMAAVQIARPDADMHSAPNAAQIARFRAALASRIDAPIREKLERAVAGFESDRTRPDLRQWLRRLELTATRAGLLACGDMSVATSLVEKDPAPVGDLAASAKLDDLFAFATSEAYEQLRRELGLSVSSGS